jgi:KDO2-lipid IV(A) lauroyltransferase
MVYAAFRVAWGAFRLVPPVVLRRSLEALGRIAWLLDQRHRDVVQSNLSIAFPQWRVRLRRAAERQAFANWGRIAAELVHIDRLTAGRGPEDPTVAALGDAAAPLLSRSRGLLVLTAHTGNFELLARLWGRATGVQIAVFHRALKNRRIDEFLRRERATSGFRVVARGGAVREALRILSRGGIFVVPLDQNQLPGRGIFVDFFGRPACTSTLLARLALASGAPVLPVFAAWDGDTTVARIGKAIVPPEGGKPLAGTDRREEIRALTQNYTTEIEAAIRAYPEQWNWAHRRWKTEPPTRGVAATSTDSSRVRFEGGSRLPYHDPASVQSHEQKR